MEHTERKPAYQENIMIYREAYPVLAVSGDTCDLHPYEETGQSGTEFIELTRWLYRSWHRAAPDEIIVFYSPFRGFYNDYVPAMARAFIGLCGEPKSRSFCDAAGAVEIACANEAAPAFSVIITDCTGLCVNPRGLSEYEKNAFLLLRKCFFLLSPVRHRLVFLMENAADLPEFMLSGRTHMRHVEIGLPDSVLRRRLLLYFFGPDALEEAELTALTDATCEMRLAEILRVCERCGHLSVSSMTEAVAQCKFGFRSNPWKELTRQKVLCMQEMLQSRFYGQDKVIQQLVHMFHGAVTGFGRLKTGSSTAPRGTFMFAGPTGVGKTAMAKALCEFALGSEDYLIKVDMGEYGMSHSMERLVGAPPGFVGYEEGGQLTRQVKAKPCSIVLFDEIEKAHPAVLDKLLAVTDDGRLTDGRGETVSFENTILIFTTNLGTQTQGDPADIERSTREAIRSYFQNDLNRLEMFGRLSSGILVFDPLNRQAAEYIFTREYQLLCQKLQREENIHLVIEEGVLQSLRGTVADALDEGLGGRGVVKAFSRCVADPISSFLIQHDTMRDCRAIIDTAIESCGLIHMQGHTQPVSPVIHEPLSLPSSAYPPAIRARHSWPEPNRRDEHNTRPEPLRIRMVE